MKIGRFIWYNNSYRYIHYYVDSKIGLWLMDNKYIL